MGGGKYEAIYKCRLCGELFGDGFAGEDIAYMSVSTLVAFNEPKNETITNITKHHRNIHTCKNGSYGLADFQGFKKVED